MSRGEPDNRYSYLCQDSLQQIRRPNGLVIIIHDWISLPHLRIRSHTTMIIKNEGFLVYCDIYL